jgi:hypothetical protein
MQDALDRTGVVPGRSCVIDDTADDGLANRKVSITYLNR